MNLRRIQAGTPGLLNSLARAGLSVLSLGWRAGLLARRAAGAIGLRRPVRLPVPVVSVGNLVAGGTGKTPFVAWLVRRLRAMGRRPGILSRGYGLAVSVGGLSDEGAVLAHLLGAGTAQAEDPDRIRGARSLLSAHPETDLLVLDDGFQHRRVARDLDIVLLDASNPFGHRHLLPRGLLREPVRALARADLVVLTRAERSDQTGLDRIRSEVARHTSAPLLVTRTVPVGVERGGKRVPPEALRRRWLYVVCGIGNPEAFVATLTDLGGRVVGTRFLPDHAPLDPSGWTSVLSEADHLGAEWIVVTRKDAVKIAPLPPDLAVLDADLELTSGEPDLLRLLDERLVPCAAGGSGSVPGAVRGASSSRGP